jgi:hypothetical protein
MSRRTKAGVKGTDALIASYAHRHVHPASIKQATRHFATMCKGLAPAEQARLSADPKSLGMLADSWFGKNALALPGVHPREEPKEERPSLAKSQDAPFPGLPGGHS